MVGFFKLTTICFALVAVASLCLALGFSWLSTKPKASQEYRDACSDSMFRCIVATYYTFIATLIAGVLWCVFEVLTIAGWWPIV